MPFAKGHHPGATWKKCDFQCHSPRDAQWQGSPHLTGGSPANETERGRWAADFIAASRAAQLSAIALTDHHDACFIKYVQQQVQELGVTDDLWFFPGLEITCRDNAQCIMLFDVGSDPDLVRRALHKLPAVVPVADNEPSTGRTAECGLTIEGLFEVVAGDDQLNKHTILIPHFSDEDAHKSLNLPGFHPRFRALDCDGIYIEKPVTDLDQRTVDKIYGRIDEWGKRRRAIVPTGDNRRAAWARLGAHQCWMRLGEPTTEAIRQAMLADEARFAYDRPTLPSQRILSMRVSSSLTGEDFELTFNDGFTALIGGRGSGKTGLLEYLRFGIGRGAGDVIKGDLIDGARRERETQLIESTLKGGFVEVTLERDGVVELWRREGDHSEKITVTPTGGERTEITIDAAHRRFQARAFYQKQLSTTMSDASTAADQITGIAAAETIERRRELEQTIASAKRTVMTAFQGVAAYWQTEAEHDQAVTSVNDIKLRLEAAKARLAEEGVTGENLEVLARAPSYLKARSGLAETEDVITAAKKAVNTLLERPLALPLDGMPDALSFDELKELSGQFAAATTAYKTKLGEALTALASFEEAKAKAEAVFLERYEAFKLKHQAAVEQQAAQKALITEAEKLGLDLQRAEAVERRLALKKADEQPAQAILGEARQQLTQAVEARKELLREAAQKVDEKSDGLLTARVKRAPVPPEQMDALLAVLDRQRITDVQEKCRDWVQQISAGEAWSATVDAVMALYREKVRAGADAEPGAELLTQVQQAFLPANQLTPAQAKGVYTRLNDALVAQLVSAVGQDFIILKYRDQAGYISFDLASPGQQAAALLELLLTQEAGTLIIDQPEEDLDNKIIMKIVGVVQSEKRKRQMIFATHNPNFVVNGDADKVVALRPGQPAIPGRPAPRIDIEVDGAIETPLVREAITETMEGGRAAFDLRGRKYHFR